MLRKEASARLNDPSVSVFILEMSDCKVVSLAAMVVEKSFDPIDLRGGIEEREDKCLRRHWNGDTAREVMSILSKLY